MSEKENEQNPNEVLIKAVEASLEESLKKYDGQVQEAKSASNEVRDEVKALAEQHKTLKQAIDDVAAKGVGMAGKGAERQKDWGESLTSSDGYKSFMDGSTKSAKVSVKNTILGESGSPQDPDRILVPNDRLPGIVDGPFRALTVLDFIPRGTTNSNAIEYTREIPASESPAGFDNNAAERAEGATKPESNVRFELISDPVRTIAHYLKLSKQVLDDAPALQSYIDRRLRFGVRQRLETQVLAGNGTSPNISGLSASGRHTAYTPATGDTQFDSINKAKYAVVGRDYQPGVVFINPADWGTMERLKVGSSDGRYLAGEGAALSYINNGLTPMIWGMPVVASNNVPSGKFYVGDASTFMLMMRQEAVVEMFEQDDTNVQQNLVTVRAELRAALAVFTPAGISYGDLTL